MGILLISLFICSGSWAKTLDQKRIELKEIYEAGGISKIEYNNQSIKILHKNISYTIIIIPYPVFAQYPFQQVCFIPMYLLHFLIIILYFFSHE